MGKALFVALIFVGMILWAGCANGPFGGTNDMRANTSLPDECFPDGCSVSGMAVLPHAQVTLESESGKIWHTDTDCRGEWFMESLPAGAYLVAIRRDAVTLRQVIVLPRYEPKQANAFTTCQVLIYTHVEKLYPGTFLLEDVLKIENIPPELIEKVENALRNCRDPFIDPLVLTGVAELVDHGL